MTSLARSAMRIIISKKTLLALVLVLFCSPCLVILRQEKQGQEVVEKCKSLRPGMTRAEVEAIMGKPSSVRQEQLRGRTEDVLDYPPPPGASVSPYCVIDCETGLVVGVCCGEGFYVTEDDVKCENLRSMIQSYQQSIRQGVNDPGPPPSYEEVRAIMGEPDFITETQETSKSQREWLYFVSHRDPLRVIICEIDKKTGELEWIYCD